MSATSDTLTFRFGRKTNQSLMFFRDFFRLDTKNKISVTRKSQFFHLNDSRIMTVEASKLKGMQPFIFIFL